MDSRVASQAAFVDNPASDTPVAFVLVASCPAASVDSPASAFPAAEDTPETVVVAVAVQRVVSSFRQQELLVLVSSGLAYVLHLYSCRVSHHDDCLSGLHSLVHQRVPQSLSVLFELSPGLP